MSSSIGSDIDGETKPNPGSAFWLAVRRIDKNKINSCWMAARNALAVAIPLGVGIALGNPLGAVAITSGALNVSFSDGRDPYGQRARRMLLWSVMGALAAFIGSVAGWHYLAAVPVAALWAFVAGLLISISIRAGDLGLNTLVVLVVFEARGVRTIEGAFYTGLLVLGGGLLQTAFALLLWPVRRYEPERRAVGQAYLDASRGVDPNSDILISPLSPPNTDTQEALQALGRDHTVAGERFLLLFDQVDRLRFSIYLVKRLRDELGEGDNQRSEVEGDAASHLDSLLTLTSRFLEAISECLFDDRAPLPWAELLGQLESFVERAQAQKNAAQFALAGNIATAVDVLGGQLRMAARLVRHTTPEGEREFILREQAPPLKLQLANWLAILRANLDIRSAICRHAIRLGLCIALGDVIERSISWQRSYWLPMTIAVILKPDFTATFSRGVQRLLGTFGGLVAATVLYHVIPGAALQELMLVGVFTFLLRYLGPANYGIFTAAVSALIVFLIAATGIPPAEVIASRALNTGAGGILALIAYALWPTWERTQVSTAMADMFDSSRTYFHTLIRRFSNPDDPDLEHTLDEARREWRRTRPAAEASVDRVLSEPGTLDARRASLTGMLASSHVLMHAMMALEAGSLQAKSRDSPDALRTFGNDVEFTLYYLAAALRGSPSASETLPQLREDYRRLVEAQKNLPAQDEYVLIETDRLTVSLNTLREQVMRYLGGK